jgi:hypothetical protein
MVRQIQQRCPVLVVSAIIVLLLASCHDYYNTSNEINLEAYSQYRALDTLLDTKEYLVTECLDTKAEPGFERILIKKDDGAAKSYFILDTDAFLENDSTIIHYDPALLYDSDGGFKKDGIWFYASFF